MMRYMSYRETGGEIIGVGVDVDHEGDNHNANITPN